MSIVEIKNGKDLISAFESKIYMALGSVRDLVYRAIQDSINEYYKEKVFNGGTSTIPNLYERTYELLNSVVKTEVEKIGNEYQVVVKIDESYLNYKYPGNNLDINIPATGRNILDWNEQDASHGGTVQGDWRIWTEAMNTLSGDNGIMILLKSNLNKYGIIVR